MRPATHSAPQIPAASSARERAISHAGGISTVIRTIMTIGAKSGIIDRTRTAVPLGSRMARNMSMIARMSGIITICCICCASVSVLTIAPTAPKSAA